MHIFDEITKVLNRNRVYAWVDLISFVRRLRFNRGKNKKDYDSYRFSNCDSTEFYPQWDKKSSNN